MNMMPPPAARAKSPTRSRFRSRRRVAAPAPLPPAPPFHAFIAYADVPAAGRAMHTINEVLETVQRKRALKPMLWRFNQLCDLKWREAALADAAQADVVVLASTSGTPPTPELEAWIGAFLHGKRGSRTTLVALMGEEDAWTISIEEPASVAEPQRLVA